MEMIGGILGGVGIFLIGMILLTEGLKAAAGDALRSMLQRFARGPGAAVLSGAAITALVQSSSATTLTTIGFVSAGLLSFPQAVGVILGANLGTTSTGWLVSLVGFKVSLSAIAFPIVGVGALMRLLAKDRVAQGGMAVAGFGLIFVGIGVLQGGMEGLASRVDPGVFPGATFGGRFALVAIGLVMTVVMQSSSAAVATTLTGLHTGNVGLEQAAFLVVGQNMGTTVKAALASIGGSVPVRRTALAHILFNVITGILAVAFLPILLRIAVLAAGGGGDAVAIAVFHSAFNLLGVVVFFPVLSRFSSLVERMIPEPEPTLTRYLDLTVAQIPSVAVEAARRSAASVASLLFARCVRVIERWSVRDLARAEVVLMPASSALARIRTFLAEVRTAPSDRIEHERHLSLLHAVEHLDGFLRALRELEEGRSRMTLNHGLTDGTQALVRALGVDESQGDPVDTSRGVKGTQIPDVDQLAKVSEALAKLRKEMRSRVLEATAIGELHPSQAWDEIEMSKTLDRLGYHAWRTCHHLKGADAEATERASKPRPEHAFRTTDAYSGTSFRQS